MAGRVVGHYKIERLIGSGGMGEVYLARDVELGRAVAVKIALGTDADAADLKVGLAEWSEETSHPKTDVVPTFRSASHLLQPPNHDVPICQSSNLLLVVSSQ